MSIKDVVQFASGDLRLAANQNCWPAQADLEARLTKVFADFGVKVRRGHPVKTDVGHGFLASQREGMDGFAGLDPDVPVVVACAAWQYSHHILPGLTSRRGPILTVANWSGTWPGLVGMLNLNGSLTKAGVPYSTLWSGDFTDPFFQAGLKDWIETGKITHPNTHVTAFDPVRVPRDLGGIVTGIATELRQKKAILGVFDEGCMGMYNAIVPDDLLMPMGLFKERLSQSALYYAATQVSDAEADAALDWLLEKGMTFHFGSDEKTELTEAQVILQLKTYIAAVRIAEEFGCEAIGIQYQQGLKDLLPASDLTEGLLNNADRPPVKGKDGRIIRDGQPIVHFNEADECAAVDGLLTNRIARALGQPPETTLHDLRWGDTDPRSGRFVWVFEISGAAPPAHHIGGYAGTDSLRQPPMYFRLGGGTVRGIAKPGEIVWSRLFIEGGKLHMDVGRGRVVDLPREENERRWRETTAQWPIMHAVLNGISRDQMMGRHKANHIQVSYGTDMVAADRLALGKAALAAELGIAVHWCGTTLSP